MTIHCSRRRSFKILANSNRIWSKLPNGYVANLKNMEYHNKCIPINYDEFFMKLCDLGSNGKIVTTGYSPFKERQQLQILINSHLQHFGLWWWTHCVYPTLKTLHWITDRDIAMGIDVKVHSYINGNRCGIWYKFKFIHDDAQQNYLKKWYERSVKENANWNHGDTIIWTGWGSYKQDRDHAFSAPKAITFRLLHNLPTNWK